jgi:hypothetical protein
MATFKTSKGRIVVHDCHITEFACKDELTAAEIQQLQDQLESEHPDVDVVGPATVEVNCHGFALSNSHGWFNDDARKFLSDDYKTASFSSPQLDDVVIYYHPDIEDVPSHTGVVIALDGATITRVRSKWAHGFVVEHHPDDVRPYYGCPERLRRRKPDIPPPGEFVAKPRKDIDDASRERIIAVALKSISDPKVHDELLWASTPAVARLVIESIPAVKELLDLGPDAGRTALRLLESDATTERMASFALYILQLSPVSEAVTPLARGIRGGRFRGINSVLAADAFLNAAGIVNVMDDPVELAKREADRLTRFA